MNTQTTKNNFNIYPPNCAANMRADKYKCEVRDGGWLIDWDLFETEQDAKNWGEQHKGELSKHAANEYARMIERHANK